MIIILNKYFFFTSTPYADSTQLLCYHKKICCLYCRALEITVSVVRQNVVCSTVSDITACPVKHKPHTVDTLCFRATEALEQLRRFCVPQIAAVPYTCAFVGVSVPALQSDVRVNDPKFQQHVHYFDLLTFIIHFFACSCQFYLELLTDSNLS